MGSISDTSKQYYQKIGFASQLTNGVGTARTQQTATAFRKAGTPVYRVTVAKEIREALRALPNDRITDVTVEAITRGGHVLEGTFDDSGGTTNPTYTLDSALTIDAGTKGYKQNGMKYDITFEQGC